jgi:Peptidase family M1 domain
VPARLFSLVLVALLSWQLLDAQTPTATPDTSPFRRLELPAPTAVRTGSGAPGSGYWQQRVDYVIKATLDTVAKAVTGEEQISYTNNSPDTLRYLWLQLDQNLFTDSSIGEALFPEFSGTDGGVRIVWVGEPARAAARGRKAEPASPLHYLVNGTMMRVDLERPLPPRGRQLLGVSWNFPFGPLRNRMGIETVDGSTIYEVAQWYPRLAVYDDVRGWNTEQYIGLGEFYLEYGSFDVSLTVPGNMLVAATGTLRNPDQVLTATERARLAQARRSARTVVIRGKEEIPRAASPGGRQARKGDAPSIWRFTADSVRDFAWAAAPNFIWDAVSANQGKVLVMSFYPPAADSIWNRASEYGKLAIERYSKQWFPYPYATAVNVNGVEEGMEYPMIVFCHDRTDAHELYGVTDHEFGHTWFPMLVGSNERLYAWMDEGFNTFMNYYNWKQQYPDISTRRSSAEGYLDYARSGHELPLMTPPDRIPYPALSQVGYNKPGLGLRLLREYILGPDRFDPAFREYIRRWAYKHPTPADFFRTIEDGVGEDLSWFWRGWFYTTATIDQAVDSVVLSDTAGVVSRIHLRNVGAMPMPVELALTLSGGKTLRTRLPVEVWYLGNTYVATVPGDVTGVRIDPDEALPDLDRSNNVWPRSEPARSP